MFCFSSSLMLSLLHLIQAQTDCFLLHCDCTIERCYTTVVPYSVSHHQWRRLTLVHITFCLRVIRLKNTHTPTRKTKWYKTKSTIFVTRSKCTSDLVALVFHWSYYHSFHKQLQFDKTISKLKGYHLHPYTYSYVAFFYLVL
jgi:hypothetical protein